LVASIDVPPLHGTLFILSLTLRIFQLQFQFINILSSCDKLWDYPTNLQPFNPSIWCFHHCLFILNYLSWAWWIGDSSNTRVYKYLRWVMRTSWALFYLSLVLEPLCNVEWQKNNDHKKCNHLVCLCLHKSTHT
jgi:hypothetical protein